MPSEWVTTTEWTEEKLRKVAQKLRLRAEKNRAEKARIVEQKITKRLDVALQEKRKLTNGVMGQMLDVITEEVRSDAQHRGMADKAGNILKPGVSAYKGADRTEVIEALDKDGRPAEKLVKDQVEYGKGLHGVSKSMPLKPTMTPEERYARETQLTETLREKEHRLLDRHELRRYHNRWIDLSENPPERLHRQHVAKAEIRDLISGDMTALENQREDPRNYVDKPKYEEARERIDLRTGKELRDRARERKEKAAEKQGGLEI